MPASLGFMVESNFWYYGIQEFTDLGALSVRLS